MFFVIFWTALVRYTWPSNSSRFFFPTISTFGCFWSQWPTSLAVTSGCPTMRCGRLPSRSDVNISGTFWDKGNHPRNWTCFRNPAAAIEDIYNGIGVSFWQRRFCSRILELRIKNFKSPSVTANNKPQFGDMNGQHKSASWEQADGCSYWSVHGSWTGLTLTIHWSIAHIQSWFARAMSTCYVHIRSPDSQFWALHTKQPAGHSDTLDFSRNGMNIDRKTLHFSLKPSPNEVLSTKVLRCDPWSCVKTKSEFHGTETPSWVLCKG